MTPSKPVAPSIEGSMARFVPKPPPASAVLSSTEPSSAMNTEESAVSALSSHRNEQRQAQQPKQQPIHQKSQQREQFSSPFLSIAMEYGMRLPLRGSQETQQAVEHGLLAGPVGCSFCSAQLHCIHDAKHVVCPLCFALTPLEGVQGQTESETHSVGLGLILDEPNDVCERDVSKAEDEDGYPSAASAGVAARKSTTGK